MKELGAETIDQLAKHLNRNNVATIREAKLAMSAYFFSVEEEAVKHACVNYEEVFEELFQYGDSRFLEDRAKATPSRVITYNYDRLFERTFIEWTKSNEPQHEGMRERP
jgi:hypothetical protein